MIAFLYQRSLIMTGSGRRSSCARMSATQARSEVYACSAAFTARRLGRLKENPRRSRKRGPERSLAIGDHPNELFGGHLRVHSRPDGDDKVVALLHRNEILDLDDTRKRLEKLSNRSPSSW